MIWPCGSCVYAERAAVQEPCASCIFAFGNAENFVSSESVDAEKTKDDRVCDNPDYCDI